MIGSYPFKIIYLELSLPVFHHTSEKIHLSSSMIDPGLLPNRYLEREIHQILSKSPRILSQYGEIQGDTGLRNAMSEYLKNFGVAAAPDNLLVTSGSQQGIDLVARTFVGPGDVVVMEAPTYPGAIDVFFAGEELQSSPSLLMLMGCE
ncbi:hypothetical protein GCM10020331_085410 [Ectobacillus funiculus]